MSTSQDLSSEGYFENLNTDIFSEIGKFGTQWRPKKIISLSSPIKNNFLCRCPIAAVCYYFSLPIQFNGKKQRQISYSDWPKLSDIRTRLFRVLNDMKSVFLLYLARNTPLKMNWTFNEYLGKKQLDLMIIL